MLPAMVLDVIFAGGFHVEGGLRSFVGVDSLGGSCKRDDSHGSSSNEGNRFRALL